MAKKLLAVVIAVMMVVPMIFIPASADVTYTTAKRFDSDAGYGYSQADGDHYPSAAYHLMARFVINWTDAGAEGQHGSISWVNGSPNSAYGFDFFTGKIFVAMTGWNGQVNDDTNFLAQADYTLEDGEYYQVDWYVSNTEIKGYVNGVLAIDYVGEGLFTAGQYIISYPYACGYDLLDTSVVAQDNSATYVPDMSLWTGWNGGWSDVEVAYTVEPYEIIDWAPYAAAVDAKIAAIGNVGYNEWVEVTDTSCMSYEAAAGWGPYDEVQASIGAPYRLEIDVQIVENKDGVSLIGALPHAGGAYLGYNMDEGKFFIAPNRSYPNYDTYYDYASVVSEGTINLDPAKVYTIGLVYADGYVAVEFQGSELIRSTAAGFVNSTVHFANVNTKINVFGYRVYLLSSGALVQEDNWSAHSSNATLVRDITCTALKFVNSGAAIAAARAAYDAANAQTKALVTGLATLEAAETAYAAKVAAVAQTEADSIMALINDIGTVTVDSLEAIRAAESAYANADPAIQALVTNYETLTAARAAYNTMVANIANFNAAVDAIGDVYYQYETNRDADYDNTGLQFNYRDGDGYSTLKINDTTALPFDYRMVFDFQIVDVEEGNSFAQLAGGAQNFVVGYDFPTQRFILIMQEDHEGDYNPWTNLDPEDAHAYAVSDVYPLLSDCVYTWDLQVKGNRITLNIDGAPVVEIANGTAENTCRKDGNYFIFYPRGCVVNFANFTRYIDVGSGWVTWDEATMQFGAGPDNFSGQTLINATRIWGDRGAGYGSTVVALHADAILDDGDAISAAEAIYENLTAYEKSQVADSKNILDQKAAEYEALATPPHVHDYAAVVTLPTCTEQGYTTYTCECGDSYVADYVPATGHNFVNGVCTVCQAVDPDYVIPGDANGDGEVTTKDVTLVRRYIANYDDVSGTSTVEVTVGADFNGDGEITGKDLTAIRRFIASQE